MSQPAQPATDVPAILDIEASGFGAGSYPIEIGYVSGDGSSYCTLIRPAPGWEHWDPGAAAMHGISREVLASHGRDAKEVARELNQRLDGKVLYSDGWANDFVWLSKLYDEAGMTARFRLENLRSLLNDAEAARWHETKDSVAADLHSHRHRASTDAQVLQRAVMRVRQIQPGANQAPRVA